MGLTLRVLCRAASYQGPTLLGAQAIYISQPFLGGKSLDPLAHMLEEEQETRAFARYLRGEGIS